MKKFKSLFVVLLCSLIFIGSGYFYIKASTKPVENKTEKIPYYKAVPDSAGILFEILSSSVFLHLDFEKETAAVIFPKENDISEDEIYGYKINYSIKGDYTLLAGIIDSVGGIDLKTENGEFNFTGVQLCETLSKTAQRNELKTEITVKILENIKKIGFTREDFLYIIENSNTNLTVPDCYYWSEHIKNACSHIRIIN